jgi:hypothetical protein
MAKFVVGYPLKFIATPALENKSLIMEMTYVDIPSFSRTLNKKS